ncbi:uncharacterized protein LOC132305376 [Cornus florida]|uniref:uncharacterized protein LOC132305376 n=1 Tax=Cornus florida TaxID=4283 RepID=UPI00289EA02A|nr:uncharacterized protein LOC132305376 [Cornus florida]
MLRLRQFLKRGWSESVSQYNLIYYCIPKRSRWMQKLIDIFHLTNVLDWLKYVKTVAFTTKLRDFIFKELLSKASTGEDVAIAIGKEIYSGRGEGLLRDKGHHNLLPSVEVEYDRSLLLWHIATELCYNDRKSEAAAVTGDVGKYRDFSKLLSDYMLYLLVMELPMMSAVAGDAYLRFTDTCAQAKGMLFFHGRKKTGACLNIFAVNNFFGRGKSEEYQQRRACKTILSLDTTSYFPTANRKSINRKSMLFDACELAKELRNLTEEDKWETISRVWVELLCYAASRCGAYTHTQQLNKGGELITLVWLLLLYLGLCGEFQEPVSSELLTFNPGEEQVNATIQEHVSPWPKLNQ